MARITRKQMIEKLMSLRLGTKVRQDGKTYTIVYLNDCGGKLHRIDIGWLEDGKPATYLEPGKYLAAGKMLEFSNVQHHTLYARRSDMLSFEIISEAA